MTNNILSLTSPHAVPYTSESTKPLIQSEPIVAPHAASEQTLRIANRILNSLKSNERIIGCTGVQLSDPSASFAMHLGLAIVHLGHGPALVVSDSSVRSTDYASTVSGGRNSSEELIVTDTREESIRQSNIPGLDLLTNRRSQRSTLSADLQTPLGAMHEYKLVIVDIGSILGSTTSLMMAAKMDAIVAVASSGELTQRQALQLKNELSSLNTRFLGVVLADTQ